MKEQIEFTEFLEIEKKLEIKMGQIRSVERVPKSDKLLKLEVYFGGDDTRTVVTNIGQRVDTVILTMSEQPFITNLAPAKIMGIESQAMIMVAENDDNTLELITKELNLTPGAKLL